MNELMAHVIEGYRDIHAEQLLGIFGNPIKHTLSPVIHDTLSDALGLPERYIPFCVEEAELDICVKQAYEQGILGLNITVPHKQAVMKSLVSVDAAAASIGAVNTLVRAEGGYKGYNTDMPGLARALESENIKLEDARVIMLGAGGAARAVAYMCVYYGAKEVHILNRTYERAAVIADDMNRVAGKECVFAYQAEDFDKIPQSKYLMIQCTSVGLHKEDGLPFSCSDSFYSMAQAGVDLIYNPSETPFLKRMKQLGVPVMNGLKMLLYQGILAYELWNDLKIDDTLVNQVYESLEKAVYGDKQNNIVLIGFMGAGKTTLGKEIAKRTGYTFLDTDEYIENRERMTIPEIFKSKGEAYFRQLETTVLMEWKDTLRNTVVSTGGGLPLRSENSELLREIGTVYYLKASADTIYERVKDSTNRPLLQCENPYGRICELLEERNGKYEECSNKVIITDHETLETVIGQII